jgi:hypothetical protein
MRISRISVLPLTIFIVSLCIAVINSGHVPILAWLGFYVSGELLIILRAVRRNRQLNIKMTHDWYLILSLVIGILVLLFYLLIQALGKSNFAA